MDMYVTIPSMHGTVVTLPTASCYRKRSKALAVWLKNSLFCTSVPSSKFNVGPVNKLLGVTLHWTSKHSIEGTVAVLPVASCYRNWY